ncbi:MAG: DUF302 domain-containing protein [Candidatus Thiothrix putei]|uniref:DUF302 domain-containing protein n=1 Tax=Candidatus Thiothrix putei TaxID=3080811 RepID=A0AA95HAS8_9GAMM|nr:MAG: DUF302 domain-containing protein [Candidatus Thiothrix putei]
MVVKTLAAILLTVASLHLAGCGNDDTSTPLTTPTNSAALFLEDTSPKNLTATSAAFQAAAVANGWSILGMDNIGEILAERGYSVAPVLVFQACSGKYSSKLLGSDDTRFVASMIPCRVALYQKSTGEVIISRMNSISMGDKIGGEAGSVMKQSGQDMETIIQNTLSKLKS